MITQKINLNLIPNGVMPRVNVSQYDYGSRTLEITLYNGSSLFTIPTGANVIIQGTKKDNRGFQYSNLEFSGSVVTADITQQMTVFEDEVQVELVIITGSGDNTQQLATANFILNVEPAALKSDIVVSETDIPAIQTLPEAMEEVEAAVKLIETVLPAIEGAEAWAVGTKDGVPVTSEDEQYHNNSKYYAEQASTSETNAGLSASAASGSATSASGSAEDAEAYGIGKRGGVDVTSGDVAYQNNSKYYAGLASNSANNASTSETNAGLSESAASGYSDESEAWATGEINGTPVASDKPQYHNSAKWWADQASQAAGGGVTSFNGRSGSVSPADGDYNITQIAPTSGATEGQVVVVNSNGDFTVDDAPSSGHTIKDSTTTFTQRDNLKFTGAGVSVSDDSSGNATVVSISGSGANLPRADYETSPATAAHAIDDILYYNNKFYDVTSAIAIGDTLTVSSGLIEGNISERPGGMSYEVFGIPGGGPGGTITADDISYNNTSSGLSATKVQGAIDEVNGRIAKHDISSTNYYHLELDTPYTVPSDGYFVVRCNNVSTSYAMGKISGVTVITIVSDMQTTATAYPNSAVFVKKGATISVSGSTGSDGVFYPLV